MSQVIFPKVSENAAREILFEVRRKRSAVKYPSLSVSVKKRKLEQAIDDCTKEFIYDLLDAVS